MPTSAESELIAASKHVEANLRKMELDLPNLSSLGRHQWKGLRQNPENHLRNYRFILQRARERSGLRWSEMVLVDYGGGPGLLAMLARSVGVKTVIYSDIHPPSGKDAETIAMAAGLKADHYVSGDVDALAHFMKTQRLDGNVIASYDVLEHIYDLPSFFRMIPALTNGKITFVMATGANAHNPRIRRSEVQKQIATEHSDREKLWGEGIRDSRHSYLSVRADIIRACDPGLPQEAVLAIARQTRGLIRPQITQCVAEFLKNGAIAYRPSHPTNTCCPDTGYWCERLLKAPEYEKMLRHAAVDVSYRAGKYGTGRWLARAANITIKVLGRMSLPIAPFILFEATFVAREDSAAQ